MPKLPDIAPDLSKPPGTLVARLVWGKPKPRTVPGRIVWHRVEGRLVAPFGTRPHLFTVGQARSRGLLRYDTDHTVYVRTHPSRDAEGATIRGTAYKQEGPKRR
jgi:hypothetical protein